MGDGVMEVRFYNPIGEKQLWFLPSSLPSPTSPSSLLQPISSFNRPCPVRDIGNLVPSERMASQLSLP